MKRSRNPAKEDLARASLHQARALGLDATLDPATGHLLVPVVQLEKLLRDGRARGVVQSGEQGALPARHPGAVQPKAQARLQ